MPETNRLSKGATPRFLSSCASPAADRVIQAAMAFSAGVEALNMLGRRSASKKEKAEAARALTLGQSVSAGPWTVTLDQVWVVEGPNYLAEQGRLTVRPSNDRGRAKTVTAERRFFPAGGQTTTEVGLDFRGLDDVYAVMGDRAATDDGELKLYDARKYGQGPFIDFQVGSVDPGTGKRPRVTCAKFSPDGERLVVVTGDVDHTVHVFDWKTADEALGARGLTEEELKTLGEWRAKFESKYPRLGTFERRGEGN